MLTLPPNTLIDSIEEWHNIRTAYGNDNEKMLHYLNTTKDTLEKKTTEFKSKLDFAIAQKPFLGKCDICKDW
jgi:hypothetical protein